MYNYNIYGVCLDNINGREYSYFWSDLRSLHYMLDKRNKKKICFIIYEYVYHV